MKKQAANRMHNFPDADLYLQSMDRIRFALRDIKEFENTEYHKSCLYNEIDIVEKLLNEDEKITENYVINYSRTSSTATASLILGK